MGASSFSAGRADSALARVDARVNVLLLLAYTAVLFWDPHPAVVAASFALLALCIRAAGLRARAVAATAKPVAVILAFTLCANLVSCDGTAPVRVLGAVGVDLARGARGLMAVMRIVLLIGFSLTVSASTTPVELGDAVVRLMRPLGRVGVPVPQIGSMLSIALRFIPVVADEFQRIQRAQRARGVRFDEGPLRVRIGRWAAVLTPLIVALFRRADRLADSMAARCYADGSRCQVPSRSLGPRDRVVLGMGIALCVALVLCSRFAL